MIPVAPFAQATPAASLTPPDDTPSIKLGVTLYTDYTYQDSPQIENADGNTINPNQFNVTRAKQDPNDQKAIEIRGTVRPLATGAPLGEAEEAVQQRIVGRAAVSLRSSQSGHVDRRSAAAHDRRPRLLVPAFRQPADDLDARLRRADVQELPDGTTFAKEDRNSWTSDLLTMDRHGTTDRIRPVLLP